jgi:hypothetical protein
MNTDFIFGFAIGVLSIGVLLMRYIKDVKELKEK